ncbi:MAG TPA: hypothetical protein VJT75_08750 [Thermoleophilaceae bacterium]|nr:hypothetical protein [Thermoleophilaceae bacterium]
MLICVFGPAVARSNWFVFACESEIDASPATPLIAVVCSLAL